MLVFEERGKPEFPEKNLSEQRYVLISDIPQFKSGNIRSRDVFRPIARELKSLMDCYYVYGPCEI